ncbi:MAG: MBOAT family O-acyltransferase [Terriglobales bacterium]|jgi:alginate O-acetyltransferase complex protein AlgI
MTIELLGYGIGVVVVWLVAMRLRSVTARQSLYLVASYIFYFSWGSWLIVVLLFSSLMNYALGEWLKKRITAGRLWTGIIFNLALLSVFKYLPLLGAVAPSGSPLLLFKRILFPIGISFWTFEALSYLLELYREEELNPTLLEFCLYMAFWPTVLQGPICRMSSMLPQLRQDWAVADDDLKTGVRRISIGVFMVVLSEVMSGGLYAGAGVDAVFDHATFGNAAGRLGGIDVWCMIIAYAFQLYFSFCGYSHVVIGAARLFGIQLHENFNRPYLSSTISVFWTRWHMSLSFWIRDFLFLPLATVRRELWWRNLSLVIAMFAFGVWHIGVGHGTYLLMIWGIYQGILLVLHRQWQEFRKRMGFEWSGALATGISWLLTFSAVCIGYIFFRANSIGQAFAMLKALASLPTYRHLTLDHSFYVMTLLAAAGYFAVIGAGELLDRLGEARLGEARLSETASGGRRTSLRTLFGTLARERWVWITPMVLVLALYLSVIFQPGQAETGPVMYALF